MSAVNIQNVDELRDLYRELILDHSRSPRNFGKLADATHTAEGINPLCGDKLRLYLRLNHDDVIADASFEGSGCAISVASASLLTDIIVKGMGLVLQQWLVIDMKPRAEEVDPGPRRVQKNQAVFRPIPDLRAGQLLARFFRFSARGRTDDGGRFGFEVPHAYLRYRIEDAGRRFGRRLFKQPEIVVHSRSVDDLELYTKK